MNGGEVGHVITGNLDTVGIIKYLSIQQEKLMSKQKKLVSYM